MVAPTILHRRIVTVVLATAIVALPCLVPHAEAQKGRGGPQTVLLFPGKTDAGTWAGSWFYINRTHKWVFWFREQDGLPQLRARALNVRSGEGFETDWSSSTDYTHRGRKGVFKLTITERKPDIIRADWYWRLGTQGIDDAVRTETAKVTLYRASDGRKIVMQFEDYELVLESEEQLRLTPEQAWAFRKASRRELLWSEFPF